jgi:Holliday junction resolvase RusA-like endonuclease
MKEKVQYQLEIKGPISSKKNKLQPRHGKGKGLRYRDGIKEEIDGIVLQMQSQYDGPKPIADPVRITILVACPNPGRTDGDGVLTNVLDCLKQAGIISDDNLLRVPDSNVIFDIKGKWSTEVIITRCPFA